MVCTWSIAEFCYVMDMGGRYLSTGEVSRMRYAGQQYLTAFAWLARSALRDRVLRWQLRPKLHMLEHVVDELVSSPYNLRYYWKYGDEDAIGRILEVFKHDHPWTQCKRTIERYLIHLALAWSGRGSVPYGIPEDWESDA